MKTNMQFWSYIAQFFSERETLQTKVTERIKTHVSWSRTLFFENRAVYEIMLYNIVQPGRPHMTTWCMRISRLVTKATYTHSQYVILIDFMLQQRLHERASV